MSAVLKMGPASSNYNSHDSSSNSNIMTNSGSNSCICTSSSLQMRSWHTLAVGVHHATQDGSLATNELETN